MRLFDLNRAAIQNGEFTEGDDAKEVDTDSLGETIDSMLVPGVLVVGHLAPYVVDGSRVKAAVVLRKNPYDLTVTYRTRGYPEKKIMENLGSEILGTIAHDAVTRFGPDKTAQIDTTSRSVPETTRLVEDALYEKGRQDIVDWLGLVSVRNDLRKFFAYGAWRDV